MARCRCSFSITDSEEMVCSRSYRKLCRTGDHSHENSYNSNRHNRGFVGGVVSKIDIVLLLWVERDRIGMGCSNL